MEIGDVWNWYEMYGTKGGRYRERIVDVDLAGMQYVDSWRLYDLKDGIHVTSLDGGSVFTVIPSKHFPDTTLVTVLEATDLSGLASYVAEKIMPVARAGTGDGSGTETGDTHGWNAGIHIVSSLDASLFERSFKKIGSYSPHTKEIIGRLADTFRPKIKCAKHMVIKGAIRCRLPRPRAS